VSYGHKSRCTICKLNGHFFGSSFRRLIRMPGVVFLIVVPTANFERELIYGKSTR